MQRSDSAQTSRWSDLLADFTPRRLPATVITGVVLGLVNALLGIALLSLIFTGDLRTALPVGIGIGLFSSALIALLVALLSHFPGMYAGIQDNSAAILGLAAASIAGSLAAPSALSTVLAMIAVTSLAVGVVFLVAGTFSLGEIAKFVPFPVIGGLLAGTGYLILAGSIDILSSGAPVSRMVSADSLGLFWPGVALAAAYFTAARRSWSPRWYLVFLLGSVVAFHVVAQVTGLGGEAVDRGWLLGPFPEGGLWPGFVLEAFTSADWGAVLGELGNLVTILLIAPLSLLLYISALETETKRDLDLNAELRATGWANLAAGVVGGPPGYFYLADTVVTQRLIGGRRGPAVVAGLAIIGVVAVGGGVLELIPQFLIGGLLLFVGADFMYEWLWISRRRMSRLDYGLMVGIVVIIALIGFLPGVAVGLTAAIVLFVYRYSRIDVVKHLLTAREHQSNIERPEGQTEYLRQSGDAVLVLELQGFIFFGTANRILDRVKAHLLANDGLRYVIFDFKLVPGMDSSAVALFERIALLARDTGLVLILTGLKPGASMQFEELLDSYPDVVERQVDLDHGMASCEERLLDGFVETDGQRRVLPEGLADQLEPYLQRRTIEAGERLMTQGESSPGLFLIESGRATVLIEEPDGTEVRLRTLLEGTVLGEISLYRGELTTATVVADTRCEVLHLTPEAFVSLCGADSDAAAALHAFVARTLAGRVSHANRTITALHG